MAKFELAQWVVKSMLNMCALVNHLTSCGACPQIYVNKYDIVIPNLVLSDEGNYTCIIKNEHGSLNWTYELKIQREWTPLAQLVFAFVCVLYNFFSGVPRALIV